MAFFVLYQFQFNFHSMKISILPGVPTSFVHELSPKKTANLKDEKNRESLFTFHLSSPGFKKVSKITFYQV